MSAAKKRPARKTPKSRKPVDKPRELARKARLPHVYTRSEMHEIMQDLRDRDKVDSIELKLTEWSDTSIPRGGIKTLGDLMIALSGVQWGSTNPRWSIGLAFHAITADLEVMAQHELGRRAELQKSNMLYRGDLYAALSNLAQRCRALGEVMPRILLANEKPEGGAS